MVWVVHVRVSGDVIFFIDENQREKVAQHTEGVKPSWGENKWGKFDVCKGNNMAPNTKEGISDLWEKWGTRLKPSEKNIGQFFDLGMQTLHVVDDGICWDVTV